MMLVRKKARIGTKVSFSLFLK